MTVEVEHHFSGWEGAIGEHRVVCTCGWRSSAGISYEVAGELDTHHAEMQGITVEQMRKRDTRALKNRTG